MKPTTAPTASAAQCGGSPIVTSQATAPCSSTIKAPSVREGAFSTESGLRLARRLPCRVLGALRQPGDDEAGEHGAAEEGDRLPAGEARDRFGDLAEAALAQIARQALDRLRRLAHEA